MDRAVNLALIMIPTEIMGPALALLLMLGGFCMVVGARKAATGLITTAITFPFIVVIVEALFNDFFAAIPAQYTQLAVWLVLGVSYLLIFGRLMSFLFGRRVWDDAKGNLLAYAIRRVFILAFSWQFLIIWIGLGIFFWSR